MVEKKVIERILKRLEKYLIRKNDFILRGTNFEAVLFIPSERYLPESKYSLILSAKILNNFQQKDIIKEILNDLKESLTSEEYNAISRLNIIHSEDPFVKNLKLLFGFREQVIEINDIPVGGIDIEYAFLVKSLVLDKLFENRVMVAQIWKTADYTESVKMGIIRIDKDFAVVYYTGKGLREIWKPQMTDQEKEIAEKLKQKSEDFLIQNQYIEKVSLDDIQRID